LDIDTIICGDCLEIMPQIPDNSIDMVLADLPYGVTDCKWDTPLPEYLIKTYTNEGDTVLDPTCGSGTTAVACRKSNRHYICIEKEQEYVDIARKRVAEML